MNTNNTSNARVPLLLGFAVLGWISMSAAAAFAGVAPARQQFQQEMARHWTVTNGLPAGKVQLLQAGPGGIVRAFATGAWYEFEVQSGRVKQTQACPDENTFVFAGINAEAVQASVAWRTVKQVLTGVKTSYVLSTEGIFAVSNGKTAKVRWEGAMPEQLAVSKAGDLIAASAGGLVRFTGEVWEPVSARNEAGLDWGKAPIAAVAFDEKDQLWFGSKAGVACRRIEGWKFYEGKDGLPWNEFSAMATSPNGDAWFGTTRGAIRYAGGEWHYRQGPRWLLRDHIVALAVDRSGQAWFATEAGVSCLERRTMTLAEKAEHYEQEIDKYIKRTPYGFVAEAHLRRAADRNSADPGDSDNDGLWTAMYGAGEAFGYAATGDEATKERAKKAFEALRFLQKVTQGGSHEPPKGYVARTVRSVDLPDPNIGRLQSDLEGQKGDRLWKAYEPRWPKSADGKWYWKSDTSSDELDGHYFFYPLYFDFCAETESEKERVREVVRDLTDHLVKHNFTLIDHDGKPTRWGIYGPAELNNDLNWWGERGLKSLSMLSYLAVAAHVTGDGKYTEAARKLIDDHGYGHNLMYPKIQNGPGSGNQSDDEMAIMCFYHLLRYSKDEKLKELVRISYYRYWANEQAEMNPFFHFAYAAHTAGLKGDSPFGAFPIDAWQGWHEDSMKTLYGFPLDRLDWAHQNSHRLDIVRLWPIQAIDFRELDHPRLRGYRTNGKVLPVENRHFGHWNTDPWRLDYNGGAHELSAGTVFLLPYYMGLYHGYIEKPSGSRASLR